MILSTLFFLTAMIYASVGFGGGSTYAALLVLNGVDYKILPFITLICNIIVVSGGVWHFSANQHIKLKTILPWISLSVPAAWVGGYIQIPEGVFIITLGSALLLSSFWMFLPDNSKKCNLESALVNVPVASYLPYLIGPALGFLAGVTGIGGGIFLAPVLHFIKWGNPKNIAGACSVFILLNSLSGLVGQAMKLVNLSTLLTTIPHWTLLLAVFIGGQAGSRFGSAHVSSKVVKKLTAFLILYVAIRLLSTFFK
jgi:uncharacterized membrane protein YfcA